MAHFPTLDACIRDLADAPRHAFHVTAMLPSGAMSDLAFYDPARAWRYWQVACAMPEPNCVRLSRRGHTIREYRR